MKKMILLLALSVALTSLAAGCDALQGIAPPPQATVVPTSTTIIDTATPLPTMGALEFMNAAYCFDPGEDNLDAEYNLLSFYSNGVVLEMTVQGFGSCPGAWEHVAPYLSDAATDTFNHGEYQLSGSRIQFWLAPAGSNESAGTVTGRYEGDKLVLQRQGAEMEYLLVHGGK